ncbi:D-alanyl-lipoteichoic acid acyltransferase DltB (MBOAT superfamily) [Lewinella aquimaris]|uniref:D-alanyl-lipoteichoic acid acyltransferase DltB (MBOAT superfamily) n=2 Tax=Neolewinella aquimaris TaxID=1835722 RepID=A0A840E3T9_9BACT|nr:MBOAT family O-acyltransferase [Neolewinella aquimaris]MBB4080254.1 D-alanyl-lipoteichoic acid acyltransferase DltB (MBOAT superfamily) [Neolewinella aquimaris]
MQNALIVLASYVFYGWWDWRFLFLIFFSTVVDYSVGRRLGDTAAPDARKILLFFSLFINLGLLGFFKYYNFFVESFTEAFTIFGYPFDPYTLSIVLPVGISFYTFQTLSYSIDVYQKRLEPSNNFLAFSAFVSFFPQLVAGPIERATHLLPQFLRRRTFSYPLAVDGMRQILWGFFKKVVIADNCGELANEIFNNYEAHDGSTLLLGALFFTFQIYGDFSGYSDIAIGTARLLGFDLMQNFAFPYFSRDIAEFWRRWHISLTTWFRDYVYIPLGGSRAGKWVTIRNVFIIFLVSGFWHGANWTFIVWGALNALYFLPLLLAKKNRQHQGEIAEGRVLPSFKELTQIAVTFGLTVVAWIFFRSPTVGDAIQYLGGMLNFTLLSFPSAIDIGQAAYTITLIVLMLVIEWFGRFGLHALERLGLEWHWVFRWSFYAFILMCILIFIPTHETPFIYFQF